MQWSRLRGTGADFYFIFIFKKWKQIHFIKILQNFEALEALASFTPKTPRDFWLLCHSRVLLNVPDLKGPDGRSRFGVLGRESSCGLASKSLTESHTCRCIRRPHQGVKKWLLLLRGRQSLRESRWTGPPVQCPPGPFAVSSPLLCLSNSQLFQKPGIDLNAAVEREPTLSPDPPNSHVEGSEIPCSREPSVCLVSMPARGLGLPQPLLWATCSCPVPFSSLMGPSFLGPASRCYDSQRQGPCGSAQPSSGRQQGWTGAEGAGCLLSGLGVGEGNVHVYGSPGNGLWQ